MIRLGLLACVKTKKDGLGLHPARDLYCSTLFSYAKRYLDTQADEWYVLSAKYGLIHNETPIKAYDLTLNDMPAAERRAWALMVWSNLRVICTEAHLTIIAGIRYREFLIPYLIDHKVPYEVPFLGLGIGEQLARLRKSNT